MFLGAGTRGGGEQGDRSRGGGDGSKGVGDGRKEGVKSGHVVVGSNIA